MGRVCFVFLDGVGVGRDDGTNPFSSAPMPHLRDLLRGGMVAGREMDEPGLLFRPIDAGLGVAGLPQSATGQTALFTGVNAPAEVGGHISAFPTASLRAIIQEHALLKRATEMGRRATFANAYSERYWQLVAQRKLRHSATTLMNLAAGLPFRTLADLERGDALYWDIVYLSLRELLGLDWPLLPAEESGRRLATLAAQYDLVVFESFLTDLVGHGRFPVEAAFVLDVLDRFIGGLLRFLPSDVSLVVCSDHGNLEDAETTLHTMNPVPLLVVGPGAGVFRESKAITDVTPGILRVLWNGKDGA